LGLGVSKVDWTTTFDFVCKDTPVGSVLDGSDNPGILRNPDTSEVAALQGSLEDFFNCELYRSVQFSI
jgi:hypothetical protein